jgi:serine/threonine-protein kinase
MAPGTPRSYRRAALSTPPGPRILPTRDALADASLLAPVLESPSGGPREGAVFAGRYRVERLLGRGGMGAVYLAFDELLGDRVALKTLDLGHPRAPSAAAIERFKREVRLARRVSHPGVARVHDLGEHAGVHFLTMEFVDGLDLDALLEREKQLAPVRAVRLALAIAEGLGAAHAAGVVHRDLKPGNVLLDAAGRVLLTDFGIARGLADEASQHRTMGPVGTPLYMAPEQVQALPVDARTDVYALGLMLYEMVVGTHAFVGDTPIATALARLQQPPPDPRAAVALDDPLATLILACLAREPEGRPADGRAVAASLRLWLHAQALPGEAPEAHVAMPGSVADAARRVTEAPTLLAETGLTQDGATSARDVPPPTPPAGAAASRSLAVLPFRHRGPAELAYLGDGLAEELTDVLSRTRGLRLAGSGATARFRDERDPRTVGQALGVDAVVDGTVQSSSEALRLSVRLIDVASGTQLWSERFEAPLEDVFEVQERVSRRVAEALRVSLDAAARRESVPADAVDAYMRGRRALALSRLDGPGGAVALFDEAISRAPGFAPALAGHALAALRAWFAPSATDPAAYAAEVARSVERARRLAPDVAESHLAAALYAMHSADYAGAGRSLSRALALAPTFAAAHQAFGALAVESGRLDRGVRHLRAALELDPTLAVAAHDLARTLALAGDRAASRRVRAAHDTGGSVATLALEARVAAWYRDDDALRALLPVLDESHDPLARFSALYVRLSLGVLGPAEGEAIFEAMLPSAVNPRFLRLALQSGAEVFAGLGRIDDAVRYLARAVEAGLVDVEWLDRCPKLGPLRGEVAFREIRRECRRRADAFWSGVQD